MSRIPFWAPRLLAIALTLLAVPALGQPNARAPSDAIVLPSSELAGSTGVAKVGIDPFFQQSAVFTNVVELEDEVELRYVVGGTYRVPAGTRLFWRGERDSGSACGVVETVSKCYKDLDGDGALDTAFYGGAVVGGVYLFPQAGPKDRALRRPARYHFVDNPYDVFVHKVGLAVTAASTEAGTLSLVIRGNGGWVRIEGSDAEFPVSSSTPTHIEYLGGVSEIEMIDPTHYRYRVLSPFPEQPLDASVRERTATRYYYVAPVRVR